jgi:hypothetical protein
MAKANITIPDLAPGQKYKLVIASTNNDQLKFNLPGIEFTALPQVIPINSIPISITSEIITVGTIPASQYTGTPIVTNYPAVSRSGTISAWSRTDGSYSYTFTVNSTSGMAAGYQLQVTNISSGLHRYYDQLYYVITGVPSSTTVNVTASYRPDIYRTFCHPDHNNKTKWNPSGEYWQYIDGRSGSTASNANAANYSFTIPAYSTTTIPTLTTPSVDIKGFRNILTINDGNPISLSTQWSTTVKDVPIFFFLDSSGEYYYFNTAGTAPDATNLYKIDKSAASKITSGNAPKPRAISATEMNSYSSFPLKAIHYLGDNKGDNSSLGFKYYFTIARYIFDGVQWNGEWLQKKKSFIDGDPKVMNLVLSGVK